MITTEAGIVKRIEFKTVAQRQRYISDLRVRGKGFYIISDGYTSDNGGRYFLKTVESDGKHKLIKGITSE